MAGALATLPHRLLLDSIFSNANLRGMAFEKEAEDASDEVLRRRDLKIRSNVSIGLL
jgi:hypothetical protein